MIAYVFFITLFINNSLQCVRKEEVNKYDPANYELIDIHNKTIDNMLFVSLPYIIFNTYYSIYYYRPDEIYSLYISKKTSSIVIFSRIVRTTCLNKQLSLNCQDTDISFDCVLVYNYNDLDNIEVNDFSNCLNVYYN